MKSIFSLAFIALMFTEPLQAQRTTEMPQPSFTKEQYLQLSKKQKSEANTLVVTGGAIGFVGGFVWFISPIAGLAGSADGVKNTRRTGIALTAVGATLAAFSIPLYNASKKNLKNAELYASSGGLLYPVTNQEDLLCIGVRINL